MKTNAPTTRVASRLGISTAGGSPSPRVAVRGGKVRCLVHATSPQKANDPATKNQRSSARPGVGVAADGARAARNSTGHRVRQDWGTRGEAIN